MGKTNVSIQDGRFYFNGTVLNKGKYWEGHCMEGLLMNARMANAIFDDLNPETVSLFRYPDTGFWDPDRNTKLVLEAMPQWRKKGLTAIAINMQGGQPGGFDNWYQKFHKRGYQPDGSLHPDYMRRLALVLDQADALGMAVILGLFYWGQDHTLANQLHLQGIRARPYYRYRFRAQGFHCALYN